MSMNATYRAVSGALAKAILADPSLATSAVDVSSEAPGEAPGDGGDALSLPPDMRAMFERLPPAQREKMLTSPKFAKFRAMVAAETAASE